MKGSKDLGACGLCSTDCALFLRSRIKGRLVVLVARQSNRHFNREAWTKITRWSDRSIDTYRYQQSLSSSYRCLAMIAVPQVV